METEMSNEVKTFTQDEVDKKVRDTAEASFKAGVEKATKSKEAEAQNRKFEETQAELEKYKQKEQKELRNAKISDLTKEVTKLEGLGLRKAGARKFLNEHYDSLKDVKAEDLEQTVKGLKKKLDKDDKELYFTDESVDPKKSFDRGNESGKAPSSESAKFLPGTGIRSY